MKEKLFLLFIIFIAFVLRFWNLSNIPVSLSHDEVAIGYNAWSILQTGKDEYGTSYPVLFRSFEDYKLPGYIYSTAISEKLFGITPFGVRFPSAVLGVLTVVALYFLVKELIPDKNSKIPLLASMMLSISPWHVNFSRAAFEANGSLFFIVLSVLLLFKGVKNNRYFILASFFAAISIYFYYTARVLLPILFISIFILYRKEILKNVKYTIFALLLALILLLPLSRVMFNEGSSRLNQISIFNDRSLTNPYSEAVVRNNNSQISKVIYNRRLAFLQEFSDNYLKNFSPDFYFTNGTGPMGLLYLWEIPFFFSGIYFLLKIENRRKWIILIWFLTVPVVGGLSLGQPNALRTLANAPVVAVFTAFGLFYLYLKLRKQRYFKVFMSLFILISVFSFLRFLMLYFDYYNNLNASGWQDGSRQMVTYVAKHKSEYDSIYITGENWRPYIFYLFYNRYSPLSYQALGSKDKIENIYFGTADWDKGNELKLNEGDLSLLIKGKTLFILSNKDLLSQERMIRNSTLYKYKLNIVGKINGDIIKNAYYAVILE